MLVMDSSLDRLMPVLHEVFGGFYNAERERTTWASRYREAGY